MQAARDVFGTLEEGALMKSASCGLRMRGTEKTDNTDQVRCGRKGRDPMSHLSSKGAWTWTEGARHLGNARSFSHRGCTMTVWISRFPLSNDMDNALQKACKQR